MCLGIPGRITRRWTADDGAMLAVADFAGEERTIRLNYLPHLDVGDYTIVHAGFALTALTEEDAIETVRLMREVGVLAPEPAMTTTAATSVETTAGTTS